MMPPEEFALLGVGEHDPDAPIQLTVERVACPRHAEPFRAAWPSGFTVFGLKLTEELLNDQTVMDVIDGQMEKFHELMDSRPLCERVSMSTLQRIYIESGIGVEDRCQICHEINLGAPYTARTSPTRRPHRYRHVCFRCVVYTLRPLD